MGVKGRECEWTGGSLRLHFAILDINSVCVPQTRALELSLLNTSEVRRNVLVEAGLVLKWFKVG